jgi:hypothetical protein
LTAYASKVKQRDFAHSGYRWRVVFEHFTAQDKPENPMTVEKRRRVVFSLRIQKRRAWLACAWGKYTAQTGCKPEGAVFRDEIGDLPLGPVLQHAAMCFSRARPTCEYSSQSVCGRNCEPCRIFREQQRALGKVRRKSEAEAGDE